MLPRKHLSTTSSHMYNVTPNVMLDALGLNPVIETPWSGGATCHPKTSVLKFCYCKRTGTISHLFPLHPRCAAPWELQQNVYVQCCQKQ